MSLSDFAIADTCFLIDWSYWSHRNVLFKLFRAVFVPEVVLREVKSERAVEWIAAMLASGQLALYTETSDVVGLATRIVERSRLVPGLRGVDLPEAICLAVGKLREYVVLTENRGAIMAVDFLEELSGVVIWRALEVVKEAIRRGFITGDPRQVFKLYEEETKHRFSRAELEAVINELGGEAGEVEEAGGGGEGD
jgi:predicted nucleic acid-binding protein